MEEVRLPVLAVEGLEEIETPRKATAVSLTARIRRGDGENQQENFFFWQRGDAERSRGTLEMMSPATPRWVLQCLQL